MNPESTIIFTDGSSKGNPGPGGWAAIIIFKENNDAISNSQFLISNKNPKSKIKILEVGGGEEHTTNNRMELRAAIEALSFLKGSTLGREKGRTLVFSDSSYVINGITKWIHGWKKNGWQTKAKDPVENRDLWEKLVEAALGKSIEWKYVGGHVGIVGNERTDIIATSFANHQPVSLYEGSLEKYPIKNVLDISSDESQNLKKSTSSKRGSARAYSYLSLVHGKIETHKTWKECETRVKGVSGAKFKKSMDEIDEKKIIEEWK